MPEVFRDGALVYFFYSNEGNEPIHIHVRRGTPPSVEAYGKWWLGPVRREYASNFSNSELRRIEATIMDRAGEIREAWNRHFGRP